MYFYQVYHFAYFECSDCDLADQVVDQTFDAVRKNVRSLKKSDDVRNWILQTARYSIVQKIYNSWERGERISEIYNWPDTIDPETICNVLKQCEDKR